MNDKNGNIINTGDKVYLECDIKGVDPDGFLNLESTGSTPPGLSRVTISHVHPTLVVLKK